jgi:hypothetical protein
MGMAGMDMGALMRGAGNPDSLLNTALSNPVKQVLARRDSIALSAEQVASVQVISDTLDAQLARRRVTLEPVVQQIIATAGTGRQNPQELAQQIQLTIQPQLAGAQREAAEAMTLVQRELSAEQWQKLPQALRSTQQTQQRGGFNAVAMLDRMLANPLPVLLELKDTLRMTPEQVAQIEKLSTDLQISLAQRREALGKRFDAVQAGAEQGRIFQELQPEIEKSRTEIGNALNAAEKILTSDQWKQVPEQIRNPFQPQMQQRGGGRRDGGE